MNKQKVSITTNENINTIELLNEDNKVVYMKYIQYPKIEGQLVFIGVDTFKKYWERNTQDEWSKYANAREHELREDYKFREAEEGFSRGYNDPVPVAEISILEHTVKPCIGFINGFTRTIWLIANGYKIIPCEVRNITSEFLSEKEVYTSEQIIDISYYLK